MPVEKNLWGETFPQNDVPAFVCPRCGKGRLVIDKKTLLIEEPTHSNAAHSHDAWEPDWVDERFVLFLRCPIEKCGEIVAMMGNTSVEQVPQEDGDWAYESLLRPKGMFPAPPIIKFPDDTPAAVRHELFLSYQMFWSDAGSCATKIRTSVERLMDHFGITKMTLVKDKKDPAKPGKMRPLELSSRIDKFIKATGDTVHKDHLHALRRIGNLGTHKNLLSRDELLDTYEVYEHALDEIIGKKSAKIAKLAKTLGTKRKKKKK